MTSHPRRLLGVGITILLLVAFLFTSPAISGLDGDGNLDVIFASDGSNRVCLGDGSGSFACSDVSDDSQVSSDVAVGDVNGDGSLDAVFANSHLNRVCLGDGSGGFSCSSLSDDDAYTSAVALGDIDNDGNLDVILTGGLVPNHLCLGDGSGGFFCRDLGTDAYPPFYALDVAVGDVNADGNLDVIFANDGPDRVCLGDGLGGFTCRDVGLNTIHSNEVALGDINRDGDIDAVFANAGGQNRVCLGDGSGGFACSVIPAFAPGSKAVALGDVNLDGMLDVVSRSFEEFGYPSQVCLGDGSGAFACSFIDKGDDYIGDGYAVGIGDIDGDGNPDVLFPTSAETPNRVCIGDGSGGFSCRDFNADLTRGHGVGIVIDESAAVPGDPDDPGSLFLDIADSVFVSDIEWMADEGITKGCNPPVNDRFCPGNTVTRGQMAAFLVRAMGYADNGGGDLFVDDDDSIFENDIDRLATAGVTKGCDPPTNDRYCPKSYVTRGQMAAFLARAMGYTDNGGGDLFVDDDDSIFENDIDLLGTAGVTKGCNPPTNNHFCPDGYVTRGQMAAFLHRALG